VPRSGWLALMPILVCTLTGCVWPDQVERASFIKPFQSRPIPPDHALIEVALLESAVGDEYVNQDIWKQADQLIVLNADRRAALDENGFRVGQLVGALPSDFQKRLLSKHSCSSPHGMVFPAGQTVPIFLGSMLPLAQSSYDIVHEKIRSKVSLYQARYCLDVTAQFLSDGKTKLTFTPKVENGEPTLPFEAVPENGTWEYRIEKACKRYPELSWDVTLGANQYFIVGARLERARTLGTTAFTQFEGELGVQRLLVIRNCRSITTLEAHQNSVEELVRADKVPPLALQATMPISRAKTN
jgi:hypothetical protein